MEITLDTFAKLNLSLDVTGLYKNGYHALDMLEITVDECDRICIKTRADNFINVYMDSELKLDNEKNTAYVAAKLFCERFNTCGVDIFISKNIPHEAGMGGSSADAAGVLTALGELYGVKKDDMLDIAVKVGCDVPYLLTGGLARVRGVGELVDSLSYSSMRFFVVKPDFGVSTVMCYRKYDSLCGGNLQIIEDDNNNYNKAHGLVGIYNESSRELINGFESRLFNALEAPATALMPKISLLRKQLTSLKGITACNMTGSGSAFYAIVNDDFDICEANKIFADYPYKKLLSSTPSSYKIINLIK